VAILFRAEVREVIRAEGPAVHPAKGAALVYRPQRLLWSAVIVCGLARTITVAKLVEHLKVETSKWAKRRLPDLATFHWQAGYGAFSVSQSMVENVIEYVDGQTEHHRKMTFQEEFRAICKKHGIEIDERYAWD